MHHSTDLPTKMEVIRRLSKGTLGGPDQGQVRDNHEQRLAGEQTNQAKTTHKSFAKCWVSKTNAL